MPGLSIDTTPDNAEWDAFVAQAHGGHHVQTSAWARVRQGAGWNPIRVIIDESGAIVAGAQILVRRTGPLSAVGYLDRAPLGADHLIDIVLEAIEDVARKERIRLLVVQPPEATTPITPRLRDRGYGASHFKTALAATVQVDLAQETDSILARMRSKTRYNLRKGLRAGVEVRQGAEADLQTFHDMLAATADRQGFVPVSLQSLTTMFRVMTPGGHLELLMAEMDGDTVSGILTIRFGDRVIYKRGAWSGRHGEAHPNEVLHWAAIQRAKAAGYRYYDFDGIEPDIADSLLRGEVVDTDRMQSVTRFKLGFGGEVVRFEPASTFLPNRALRLLHDRLYPRVARNKTVKRAIRKLRSR